MTKFLSHNEIKDPEAYLLELSSISESLQKDLRQSRMECKAFRLVISETMNQKTKLQNSIKETKLSSGKFQSAIKTLSSKLSTLEAENDERMHQIQSLKQDTKRYIHDGLNAEEATKKAEATLKKQRDRALQMQKLRRKVLAERNDLKKAKEKEVGKHRKMKKDLENRLSRNEIMLGIQMGGW